MPDTAEISWRHANLVALDLEGSGAQDRDNEAILEVAVVPMHAGLPDLADAFSTLVNPARKIQQGPWISPGLTNTVLSEAPQLSDVEPQLAERLNQAIIVGHNVAVDWRLLRRRCPSVQPSGLLDTLRLAKHLLPDQRGRSLTALIDRFGLRPDIDRLATSGQPHRALWDASATALLLGALVADAYEHVPTFAELQAIAGTPAMEETTPPRLF